MITVSHPLRSLLSLTCVALLVSACSGHSTAPKVLAKSAPTGRDIVILLDKTASVRDQGGVFKSAVRTIVKSLKPGDSLKVAEITGASVSDFDFVVHARIPVDPPFNMWSTNSAEYKDKISRLNTRRTMEKKDLLVQINRELSKKPSAMTTDLFGAIHAATLDLSTSKNKKVLVILSDMIEEDSRWRFNRVKWTPALREKILKHEKALGLVPDMRGIQVFVVGVRGPNLATTQNIWFFWRDFFAAAGAILPESQYAHTLLNWR